MKRLLILIGIALTLILPAQAQVEFGVRAGGAYSSLIQKVNDRSESGARFGFSVAGIMEVPLSANKKWALRPEVVLLNQGGATIPTKTSMAWRSITSAGITRCKRLSTWPIR